MEVTIFIQKYIDQIENLPCYAKVRRDLAYYSDAFTPSMANAVVLKRILANEYGTPTDVTLAKLCREWLNSIAND